MQFCPIMIILGICTGLLAALLQSVSYLFSRGFVMRKIGSPLELLLVSQVYMCLMALPVFFLARTGDLPPFTSYLAPLILAVTFMIIAQVAVFHVMRTVQASRIAPMLGFKIVILALVSTFALGIRVTPSQWLGVAVATGAVLLLNFSGERLNAKSTAAILMACCSYALSDIFISKLILSLAPLSVLRASIYATSVSYILCGPAALVILCARRRAHILKTGWHFALPYSTFWLVGMFALFTTFGSVGPVLGNILQSSRGIASILIAIPAAHLGFPRIEPPAPRNVVLQRLIAAVFLVAAVWLYASS